MSNLGNYVQLTVPDVDAAMEDFTSLRLYKASSQGGAYSLLTTITLVADQEAYSYQDTVGLATDWYRFTYYSTVTTNETQPTEAFPALQAPVLTFLELVRRTADRLNLFARAPGNHTWPGPSGTTTAAGSTTAVVCASYADTELPTRAYKHHYLRMLAGSATGDERRISALTNTTGSFALARALSAASGSGNAFDIYGILNGAEWRQCVNATLLDVWTPFRWPLAGVSNQTQYTLPAFIESDKQIMGIQHLTGETIREHRLTGGIDFLIKPLEGGGAYLYAPNLSTTTTYEIEGFRHPAQMFSDSDTLVISERNQRLLVVGAAARAAQRIAIQLAGLPEDRERWKQTLTDLESERQTLVREMGSWVTVRSPRRDAEVAISGWGRRFDSGRSRYY